MASLKPRSILQLTIIGFVTVATLLIAALIVTARQLDLLSYHSQQALSEAAVAMRASRALIEQTLAMERNAKQYAVLGDIELLKVYIDRRKELINAAKILNNLNISDGVNELSLEIINLEEEVFDELKTAEEHKREIRKYPELQDKAYSISYTIDKWIDRQLESMRHQTEHTQYLLKINALLLVSIALLLAALFTSLITRPLRQIDDAIHHLGSGNYDFPVKVHGPLDLQELGARLDWLRNRLCELEQLRTSFLRHVSHELKTPLAAIQEGAALLNEGLVGALNEQQNDIIKILRNNCKRLQQLIENLLRYNVDNLSFLYPMPQPVRFDQVISNVVSDHELAIKTGKIRVEQQLAKLTIMGGAEQIRVVVDNLIANAVKYSPKNSTIRINLRDNKEYAVMEISDEGPGINPEERDLVFEPFYQGKPSKKKHYQGTGLGLAIANDYVKLNGGVIEVANTSHGACLKVQFPLISKDKT